MFYSISDANNINRHDVTQKSLTLPLNLFSTSKSNSNRLVCFAETLNRRIDRLNRCSSAPAGLIRSDPVYFDWKREFNVWYDYCFLLTT